MNHITLVASLLALLAFGLTAIIPRRLFGRSPNDELDLESNPLGEANIRWLEDTSGKNLRYLIALASALALFSELAFIRFHSSCFHFFAYFKNISLLSCFLGLGIGFARRSGPVNIHLVLPLLAIQIAILYPLRFAKNFVSLLQNPISEQVSLGMGFTTSSAHTILAYAFLALIYSLNALAFIPLGQLITRLMSRQSSLIAYSWNLLGSILGILLFSLVSYMWTPPMVWMSLIGLGIAPFLFRSTKALVLAGLSILTTLWILSHPFALNKFDIYSPYQILSLDLGDPFSPVLETSNSAYQRLHDFSSPEEISSSKRLEMWARYYNLPYRIFPQPERVLVVGAGTGNDVAAAVRNGASAVEAVEIDPVILQMGKLLHPEKPYSQAKVSAINEDARAYLRQSKNSYDLIVYGLLDSHVLLSGISGGIRLDSYVYTVEALREARSRLKPNGALFLTFSTMSPELGAKIYRMLQSAFDGKAPAVYAAGYAAGLTFIASENQLVIPSDFKFRDMSDTISNPSLQADVSTDDWPFLYMPSRVYPQRYLAMIGILGLVSVALLFQLTNLCKPKGKISASTAFSWPCFFLGAGFMLIETKGITELALVYSSTWQVTAIVILGVLSMAFLANTLVIRFPKPPMALIYGLIFVSLIGGWILTFGDFYTWPVNAVRLFKTTVLTLPVFFSGFAFSAELKRINSVDAALSANILGAMLGGLLEYNSMYFGFRFLYVLALTMYLAAALSSLKSNKS